MKNKIITINEKGELNGLSNDLTIQLKLIAKEIIKKRDEGAKSFCDKEQKGSIWWLYNVDDQDVKIVFTIHSIEIKTKVQSIIIWHNSLNDRTKKNTATKDEIQYSKNKTIFNSVGSKLNQKSDKIDYQASILQKIENKVNHNIDVQNKNPSKVKTVENSKKNNEREALLPNEIVNSPQFTSQDETISNMTPAECKKKFAFHYNKFKEELIKSTDEFITSCLYLYEYSLKEKHSDRLDWYRKIGLGARQAQQMIKVGKKIEIIKDEHVLAFDKQVIMKLAALPEVIIKAIIDSRIKPTCITLGLIKQNEKKLNELNKDQLLKFFGKNDLKDKLLEMKENKRSNLLSPSYFHKINEQLIGLNKESKKDIDVLNALEDMRGIIANILTTTTKEVQGDS